MPKCRCNLIFKTAAFNFMNVPKTLISNFASYNLLFSFKSCYIPMVYNLISSSDLDL